MEDPYFSELKYLGNRNLDFIEVAVDAGTDVSDITVTVYNPNGSVRTVNALGTPVTTAFGKDVYVIDTSSSTTFNGLNKAGAVSIDTAGTVHSFVSFNDGAPVTATAGAASGLTSVQIGQAGAGASLESNNNGISYNVQDDPSSGSIPCFVGDTLILTPGGEVRADRLRPGDLVMTRDHGPQPLRWVGGRSVPAEALAANPRLRPVRITAGALGPGCPARDLLVSRQHRILLASRIARRMFGVSEILVPAIRLTGLDGVSVVTADAPVTYIHLLFDHHEVVLAQGAMSESLLTGAEAVRALAPDQQRELRALLPLRRFGTGAKAARPIAAERARVERLLQRHLKNNRPLVDVA